LPYLKAVNDIQCAFPMVRLVMNLFDATRSLVAERLKALLEALVEGQTDGRLEGLILIFIMP